EPSFSDLQDQIDDGRVRMAEDSDRPVRTTEERVQTAFERIAAGTYTPPPSPSDSMGRNLAGRPARTCGTADDLGFCTSQFHLHCTTRAWPPRRAATPTSRPTGRPRHGTW